MKMKKIVLGLGVVLALVSCGSTGSTSTLGTITKVAQISSTISEITNLLGGINLTGTQTSLVTNALKTYISNYNTIDTTKANYQQTLEGYKTTALNDIKTSVGESKYGQFISALKETSNKAKSTNVSDATLSIINSLIK